MDAEVQAGISATETARKIRPSRPAVLMTLGLVLDPKILVEIKNSHARPFLLIRDNSVSVFVEPLCTSYDVHKEDLCIGANIFVNQ